VLRLIDTRTGSYAEVRTARQGVLRVCAHAPGAAEASDITGLRVLLVADVLTRAAELRNLQVLTALASDGEPNGQQAAVEHAAHALGIHPPAARARPGEAQAALGGPIDVHLASSGVRADDRRSGLVALVGAAHIYQAGEVAGDLLAGHEHEHEPLAIRLALLSFPITSPPTSRTACWPMRARRSGAGGSG